jgi:hypothetical protein
MLWTNIILILALIAMGVVFFLLFRDGEGPPVQPTIIRKRDPSADDPAPGDDKPRD